MIEFERRKKIDTSLEMTPLIDCIFILLIFFLLTSSFIEEMGYKINLPKTASSSMIDEEKVNIFVDQDERIYINDREVSLAELAEILEDYILQDTEKLIDIKSDEDVRLKIITEVMDTARSCGVRRLSIATRYKQGSGSREQGADDKR